VVIGRGVTRTTRLAQFNRTSVIRARASNVVRRALGAQAG
jgi:hypothetical protein